jgi:hypothetical protein
MLLDHAKTAYKYPTFQEYVWAGELKLGRRFNNVEVKFLFDNAQTPKGSPYRWDFTEGHPRGRYVVERPINNIYSKDKNPTQGWLEEGDAEDSQNIFIREEPKVRGPNLKRRHQHSVDPNDDDVNKTFYEEKKRDQYSDYDRDLSYNSNSSFLQSNNVYKQHLCAFLGGNQMSKYLNSSIGEVKDLLSHVQDGPTIRVAVSRLVREENYSPRVAREIIADAEEVGAISIESRRIYAEATAENIPEKLVPMTKHESQEFGDKLAQGAMEYQDEVHPYDDEVGQDFEEGAIEDVLETKTAARIAGKIDKISSDLERIEQRLEDIESVEEVSGPSLSDIEDDLSGLEGAVAKLNDALSEFDNPVAAGRRRATEKHLNAPAAGSPSADYSHELEQYEDYPADHGDRTLHVDTLDDHHYQKRSTRRGPRRRANYGSDVMNIEMGYEPEYKEREREIKRNDKSVTDAVKQDKVSRTASRRRRTRR